MIDPRELAEAIVGSLFVAIGLAAMAAGLSARPRRDRSSVWFGVFSLLYGLRLCAKSELIQAVTPWQEPFFQYVDAFVTYAIPIPGALFVETLIGQGWHRSIRRLWQLISVYAVFAAAHDIARGQPYASMWLNAPVVVFSLIVAAAHFTTRLRSARWTTEVRAVAVTAVIFAVVAVYETVTRHGLFGRVDAEPFTMLVFTVALGWFVLTRAREQAYELVALSRELELAREIQLSLLPRQMPDVPGLRLHGTYLPMSAVAGDFYDVRMLADNRVAVIVADVSGHGVPAALVASMVKVAFAAESERYDRPGEILGGINRALAGKFDRAYVTACCLVLDHARRAVSYAVAGHPPALLRRRNGEIERLDEGGIVLTLMPGITYTTTEVPFGHGDRLLVFTDGLLEATRGGGDEYFGDAELTRVVRSLPPAGDASKAVLSAHRGWIGAGTPLSDDLTLVVVECVDG
jgi:sigma-B regulation protein RsbU (phosphoserine phosphatase)